MKRRCLKLCACLGVIGLALLLQGCETTGGGSDPINPDGGGWMPGNPSDPHVPLYSGVELRVGDLVKVNFTGVTPAPPPHEEQIREDGNITLLYNVVVKAEGKTPGELQEAIREAYVPAYFKHLTVTVITDQRFYYVGGEVKVPSRQPYLGPTTVLRAIDTAGGLTEFAKKKKIKLRRSTGEELEINYEKALKNSKLDLPVYPGDRIDVPSRFY